MHVLQCVTSNANMSWSAAQIYVQGLHNVCCMRRKRNGMMQTSQQALMNALLVWDSCLPMMSKQYSDGIDSLMMGSKMVLSHCRPIEWSVHLLTVLVLQEARMQA